MSEELVRAAQRGSESAFIELVAPLEKKLFCTAYSVVGNSHDAEDAWQNAVLQAWKQLSKLRDPKQFKLWLTRVLLNEARTILRKRGRNPIPQESLPEVEAPLQDIDQFLGVQEQLRELPEHQRQVLVLRFWLDLPLDEMALALDVPLSTAKTRLYQGIKAMGNKLRKEEGIANE